jgi:hypothetical protein
LPQNITPHKYTQKLPIPTTSSTIKTFKYEIVA